MLRSVLSSFFPPAMMIVVLPENKKQAKLLKTLFFSYALFELHKLPQIGPCPSMSTVPFWPSKTGNPGLQYWHLEPKYGS